MTDTHANSVLVVVRQTPYGTSLARSALEFALAAATFDREVAVLFAGNGVLQLVPQQKSDTIEVRNIGKLLGSFPLFDLDQVFVDSDALVRFNLNHTDLALTVQPLNGPAIRQLFTQYDHILGF